MKKLYLLIGILFFIISFSLHAQTPKWTTYNNQNTNAMLPDNNVERLDTDATGNIWIGTYFSGLVKFDGINNWTNYNKNNSPLLDNTVTGLIVSSSNIWISTNGHGLYKFDGTNWLNFAKANSGILTDWTYCVATDNVGNIWVGINNANVSNSGVVKFNGSANWSPYSFTDNYNYKSVESIAKDNAGNIWCGTNIGAYKFDGSTWTAYTKENTAGGLCGNYVKTIAVDPSGNIWFGCQDKDPVTGYWVGGGLSKFNGSAWTNYKPSNSNLKTGHISSIAFRNNDVWVGTGFCGQVSDNLGLYKYDGTTWTNYFNNSNTFPGTCVNDLVVDKNGNLWIGSSWGLTKVDFNPTSVSYTEGLPNSFALHQNYPNPFNPSTKIKYDLSSESKVVIKIYDMLGRELEKLVDENQYAGIYSIEFNAAKYSSGIYYYKLQAGNYTAVKKMLLIK